jgi:hypothetical protein
MPLENGYYYIDTGAQVESWEINAAFGRTGYMGIWEARNGYYGAINTNSDMRPNGPGLSYHSGYSYSEWRGYMHTAPAITVALFQTERRCDADTRVTRYYWNGGYVTQSWQWGTTSLRSWFRMPRGQRLDVLFDNNIGWGSSWTTAERSIYSNRRGYIFRTFEPARNFRNVTGTIVQAGETISISNRS